jgi:hypothetical protein
MALINEEAAALDYLVNYLSADTTLMALANGVWTRSVPKSAPMPAVKIDVMERSDVEAIGLIRVWDDLLFLVRATVKNPTGYGEQPDWTDARTIGNRIDVLLHAHEEVTAELQVHSFREETYTDETLEGPDNDLYLHVGGLYRLRAHAV